MAIAEEVLTDNDRARMRIALTEQIISLLQFHREWTPETLATFRSYVKVGGYLFQEDFEELARVKIRRE